MSNINHTTANIELQEKLALDLERMELLFGHRLAQAALLGLIALPLIPGALTMISVGVHFPALLGIHWAVAWALGFVSMVGIEVLGLFSIRLALKMRKFNHKAEGRPVERAPIGQGYMAAGTYLLSVLSLTVLLKIAPELAVWSLIPLGLMGALADWIFALNGDHNEREAALRKIILEEQRHAEDANEVERLNAVIAEQAGTIAALQESVKAGEQNAADLTAKFDSECKALSTEIVKLTAQLDALKTVNFTPNVSPSPELNTESNVKPAPATPDIDTVRSLALDTKRAAKAQRQNALLSILMTEFNGQPSDALNKSEIAERLSTTRQTVGKDIEELIAASRLSVNGHIEVL